MNLTHLQKFLVALILSFYVFMGQGYATTWVLLDPEDVIDQSTVIVQGTYDFSKKRMDGNNMWSSYDFLVEYVYRGEVGEVIVVGIDRYDVDWIAELQQESGNLVLFLEQREGEKFLTPVAGPNGMVWMKDGVVQNMIGERGEKFADFLGKSSPRLPEQHQTNPAPRNLVSGIVLSLLFILFVTFIFSRVYSSR